jgi:uncharacterized membrane protein YeiB
MTEFDGAQHGASVIADSELVTHFKFGALEWLWRSLTYWPPAKFRRSG